MKLPCSKKAINMKPDSTITAGNPVEQKVKTKAEQAIDTGYLVCSLLHVCRSAADFAGDNEGYPAGKHIPQSLAMVLKHVEDLADEVVSALEKRVRSGEVSA